MDTVNKEVFCQNIKVECNLNDGTDETLEFFERIYAVCNFLPEQDDFTASDREYFLLAKLCIEENKTTEEIAKKIKRKGLN